MKKWYRSKLIWVGLGMVVTAVGDEVVAGGDWKTIAMGIFGAVVALFRVYTDKGLRGALPPLPLISILSITALLSVGCGASVNDLPISGRQKVAIAIEAGCAAAATAGCFDEEKVQKFFGPLKTFAQCVSTVTNAVDTLHIGVNIKKMTAKRFSCRGFYRALTEDKTE